MFLEMTDILQTESIEEQLRQFKILISEANTVRDNDKVLIKGIFRNFYNRTIDVGIGFQRAYGSILSGDYFDLIQLPDLNYLFVFVDISGHGLPAYTTLVRLRSAITICVNESKKMKSTKEFIPNDLVYKIIDTFTDIMDASNSNDFASINFVFIYNENNRYLLRFFNRSMLFPIVIRKTKDASLDIINLNFENSNWLPRNGHLLGSDFRAILGDEYYKTPVCEFQLHEDDSILFYSDGIIEAYREEEGMSEEYDHNRIENILKDTVSLPPQLVINTLFESVYDFIGNPKRQRDDMTAVLIDFPSFY